MTRLTLKLKSRPAPTLCDCNQCRTVRGEPLIESADPTALNTISRPIRRRAKSRRRYPVPPP